MEDNKSKLYAKYTTEQLSRLLMTLVTGESGEAGPSTKAVLAELEKRKNSGKKEDK